MSNPTVQDLLKKINYIEADIEIQKQILFAIPSDQRAEMEKTVALIAEKKQEIDTLRRKIRELDPREHDRILAFEEAVSRFKQLTAERQFVSITGRNIGEACVLALRDGTEEECLVKACDADGGWTIITLDGQLRQYPETAVAEQAAQPPPTH